MPSACLVRAAVGRRAAGSIQWAVFFSVNNTARFGSDAMPSKGGSIIFEGGLVHFEVVSEGVMI